LTNIEYSYMMRSLLKDEFSYNRGQLSSGKNLEAVMNRLNSLKKVDDLSQENAHRESIIYKTAQANFMYYKALLEVGFSKDLIGEIMAGTGLRLGTIDLSKT